MDKDSSTSSSDSDEKQKYSNKRQKILKIKVKKVPHLNPEDVEEFKKQYISNAYLHEGDAEFKERLDNSKSIMFTRWDWLQQNGATYVNMLRVSNHPDENIQQCLDGKRPLCFTNKVIYKEFIKDLRLLKKSLEAETSLTNVRFVQTGSSVPGFSNNPFKGVRDRPSKITDVSNSDVDVVIVADGVKDYIAKLKAEGNAIKEYPCTTSRDGGDDMRFAVKGWPCTPSVKAWMDKWAVKMGGGVQITMQNAEPVLPPWELPIRI